MESDPSIDNRARNSSAVEVGAASTSPLLAPLGRIEIVPHDSDNERATSHPEASPTNDTPFGLTQSANDTSLPSAPILRSAPLPASTMRSTQSAGSSIPPRRRGRRPLTRETVPSLDDSQVLISLGMSPFMPSQDAIYNRNRFVRNEAISARHLSSLERSYAQSESDHARRTEDIYRILNDHKASIDRLTVTAAAAGTTISTSLDSTTEFAALRQGHTETRQAVNAILRYISSSSASSRAGIDELNDAVQELALDRPPRSGSVLIGNLTGGVTLTHRRPPPSPNVSSIPGIEEYFGREIRRTRQGPYPSSRPPRPANPVMPRHIQRHSQPPTNTAANKDTNFRGVLYGPISNVNDHVNPMAVVNGALQSASLSPTRVHSVCPAPGRMDFFEIRFARGEDASRFVEFVETGIDGHRAFFTDREPGVAQGETNEPHVASGSRSRRPWQL